MAKEEKANPFTNPLEIFISEDAVKALDSDRELIMLFFGAFYKTGAQFWHPDRNTSDDASWRWGIINWAKDELEDPIKFGFHLAEFLRPRKEKLADLKRAQEALAAEKAELEQVIWSYILAFARGQYARQGTTLRSDTEPVSVFELETNHVRLILEECRTEETVANPKTADPSAAGKAPKKRGAKAKAAKADIVLPLANFELTVGGGRAPVLQRVQMSTQTGQPTWLPSSHEPEKLTGRIVGVLNVEQAKKLNFDQGAVSAGGIAGPEGSVDAREVMDGYPLQRLYPYFRYLDPALTESGLKQSLIVLLNVEDGRPYFRILGKVLSIHVEKTKDPEPAAETASAEGEAALEKGETVPTPAEGE